MGIETLSSDVEESTEPPICACTTRHPPQLTTAASTVKPESYSEQANISAAPCRPHSLSAASDGTSAVPDSVHKYAHTLDAAELADLLQVDLQYVLVVSSQSMVALCSNPFQVMDSRVQRQLLAWRETGLTGSKKRRRYRYGKSC